MNGLWIIVAAAFAGLCVGAIIMAIIDDRANKAEVGRLQKELHNNSVVYLSAVQTFERQAEEKAKEIELKQRVLDSLNEEVTRLRRLNERLKKRQCDERDEF